MTKRYPNLTVKLSGEDGNAFAILGRCRRALRNAGVSENEIDAFMSRATSGNYDNLLRVVVETFGEVE
jgi:hypothetical protein